MWLICVLKNVQTGLHSIMDARKSFINLMLSFQFYLVLFSAVYLLCAGVSSSYLLFFKGGDYQVQERGSLTLGLCFVLTRFILVYIATSTTIPAPQAKILPCRFYGNETKEIINYYIIKHYLSLIHQKLL